MSFLSKVEVLAKSLPSISKVNKQRLIQEAQKVYDEWEQDPEEGDPMLGFGGICQDIAAAMSEVLESQGFDVVTTDSNGIGEQHVWCTVKAREGVFVVDISPYTYEEGGGYNWKKIEDVKFSILDLIIDCVSADPDDFESYIEE